MNKIWIVIQREYLTRVRKKTFILSTFLTPLLSDNSVDKSLAVWCAKDRAQAWEALMSAGTLPDSGKSCAHPLNQIAAITRRFQIQATPAIFLSDGRHIGGMRSAADIEKAMAAVK